MCSWDENTIETLNNTKLKFTCNNGQAQIMLYNI